MHYAKPKLLIVDELGYFFEANAAHVFLQLVSRRYARNDPGRDLPLAREATTKEKETLN